MLRVLVADDSEVDRRVACAILERLGHSAGAEASGEDAVRAALEERFDVIFMDVQMPGIGGIEAARRIRADDPDAPPIVALTGDDDVAAALDAGMIGAIEKPVTPESLSAALSQAIRGEKFR